MSEGSSSVGGDRLVADPSVALDAARHLAGLADECELAFDQRFGAAHRALASWTGPHSMEFRERLATEVSTVGRIGEVLRQEADRWAAAWAVAVDRRRRAQFASTVDHGVELIPPAPVEVPVAPGYEPTAAFGEEGS